MTLALERPVKTRGEQALETIDQYREAMEEDFSVEPLDAEFPYFVHELGHKGLYLARAGDNLAGAFKWRGATNGIVELKKRGAKSVIAASAGNHAAGAALAGRFTNTPVHVVVPTTAPPQKKERLHDLWLSPQLQVHTVGETFDEAATFVLEHPEFGAELHPFDDVNVAAGQGTIVDDILIRRPDIQHILTPVGGGGLAAGMLSRLEELGRTDIQVHGIEAERSNSASESLTYDELTSIPQPNKLYGGSAVKQIGAFAFNVFRNAPNFHIFGVRDDEVADLIDQYEQSREDLWRKDTPAYEPTTLVAVAGLRRVAREYPEDTIVVVGTGHNDSLHPIISPRPGLNILRGFDR